MQAKTKNIFLMILSVFLILCSCLLLGSCQKGGDSGKDVSRVDEPIATAELYHDIGAPYVSHIEPTDTDTVTMRLRLLRGNAAEVILRYTCDLDKPAADCRWTNVSMQYERADVNGYYDYYIGEIPPQQSAYRYHFIVKNNVESIVYNAENTYKGDSVPDSLSSDFLAQINFSTPDWSKGMLWYSAMPDSFYNGETFSDKYGGSINQNIWGLTHSGGLDYFGGDLNGLLQKIDYFDELNVNGLYVNPIWLANHNAGYGAMDLANLDSTFGSEPMLTILTEKLHENNMKFMLDGVFAFLTQASVYVNGENLWNTLPATDQSSPYYSVFMRDENGNIKSNQFGPIVDFGKDAAQKLIYSSPDSVMQYYLQLGIDGWRLDSSVLFGGMNTNGTKIIQDMRKYMKEVAPDSLLCIENASASTMYTDYAADTYWSQEFLAGVRSFSAKEITAESLAALSAKCYETVVRLPRATGLSLYTISADHDTMRLLDETSGNVEKAMAVHLLLMTYMGAPSLYYGEEIGMVSQFDHSFFDAMNWDRSTWNYDIFHLYKALGQFRAENEGLFKYGVLRDLGVDSDNLLWKFQRNYQDTVIMTVLNPAGKVRSGVEVDVHSLEVKNGEKLHDVLSGNSYVVQDGKVKIEIMPYGALLSNKKSQNWAGKWQLSGGEGEVKQIGENSFQVSGNRSAALPIYGNAILSLQSEGKITAFMRADNESGGAYYGAEIEETKVTVKARETKGGTEKTIATLTIAKGETLSVVRSDDNTFYVETGNGKQASSECYVEMSYEGQCGFYGEGTVRNVTAKTAESQKSTQFEKGSDSMMFTAGETAKAVIADGKLTLKSAENGVYRLTHAPMRDITVKTQMSGSPKKDGDHMGVVVWQNATDYLFAGRANLGGTVKIVFGHVHEGTIQVQGSKDDVAGELIFQLERTGVNWTARYKAIGGEEFIPIGTHLIANYSDMYAGVVNDGTSEASFEYFCFGDAVNDGQSLSAHAGYGELAFDAVNIGNYGLVSYKAVSGTWEIGNGGVTQKNADIEKAEYSTNQSLQYFRADFTVKFQLVNSDAAYVEFLFGAASENCSVRLYPNGKLALQQGGIAVREVMLQNFDKTAATRLFIVYSDANVLTVMSGVQAKVEFSVTDFAASGGNLKWIGSKAAFQIGSYQCQAYSDNYPIFGDVSASNGEIYNPNAAMSLVSEGITDFILSFKLTQFQRSKPADDVYFAFILGGTVGKGEDSDNALVLGMTLAKELFVSIGGEKVVTRKLTDSLEIGSMVLTIVVQDKDIRVFAGNEATVSSTAALEYTDSIVRGGAFTFESVNARTKLSEVFLYGLKSEENAENVLKMR